MLRRVILMCIVSAAAALITSSVSWAGGHIGKRQVHQQKRILQGWSSGQLTGWELRRLQREQMHIQRAKNRAWRDGFLSPRERAYLDWRLDLAGYHIFRAKHNPWRRW